MANKLNRTAYAFLLVGLALAATQWMSAGAASVPDADTRGIAKMMAQIDIAREKRDLKAYCAATTGAPDLPRITALACQERVKLKKAKPGDCSDANIRSEVKKGNDQCLAMPAEQFDKRMSEHPGKRAAWIKSLKELNGIDGEKLVAEERAKLK